MKKLLLVMFLTACSSINANNLPLETVQYVDLNRYLGTWYEIARFDQRFQKGCTAVTANYSLKKNGEIKVVNKCHLNTVDGKLKSAEARAWVTDSVSNAKLKVQFFLKLIKLEVFSGNYWILDLGPDYEYAMIGDPSRKYLWILSRTKEMDEAVYNELVYKAKTLNFDTSKLLKTLQ